MPRGQPFADGTQFRDETGWVEGGVDSAAAAKAVREQRRILAGLRLPWLTILHSDGQRFYQDGEPLAPGAPFDLPDRHEPAPPHVVAAGTVVEVFEHPTDFFRCEIPAGTTASDWLVAVLTRSGHRSSGHDERFDAVLRDAHHGWNGLLLEVFIGQMAESEPSFAATFDVPGSVGTLSLTRVMGAHPDDPWWPVPTARPGRSHRPDVPAMEEEPPSGSLLFTALAYQSGNVHRDRSGDMPAGGQYLRSIKAAPLYHSGGLAIGHELPAGDVWRTTNGRAAARPYIAATFAMVPPDRVQGSS